MKHGWMGWIVLVLCLMLAFGAAAESDPIVVGRASEDRNIFRYTADNGQEIYFAGRENDVFMRYEDVNFDGVKDIVITTIMGASNFYCEFFVRDGAQYVMASHPGAENGLCNYALFPEKRLVLSAQSNGFAGALYEKHLFRWEGSNLRLIRSAVSEEYVTTAFDNALYTTVTDSSQLHVTIRDFTKDAYEGETLFDCVMPLDAMTAEAYEAQAALLFDGLE